VQQEISLSLDRIRVDLSVQPRVSGLDAEHVRALEECSENWPPVVVVERDGEQILIDGFHRLAAAQNLGLDAVPVRVISAPEDGDLARLAFELNLAHGLALTLSDRRARAARLLMHQPHVSNLEIARQTGLSPTTVAAIRERLEGETAIEPSDQRVGRGGYTYTPPRRPGEMPDPGLAEIVSDTVGRLFTSAERVQQRQLANYLQRLGVALTDRQGMRGWTTAAEVAEACRLVLGGERAWSLAGVLGPASQQVIDVAVALGYEAPAERARP